MRTKALLGLAVIAASALTAAAQNNVYSLNVVGYYNVTVPAGKFTMVANQLVTTNYTVASLLSVPNGTVLYKWMGTGYAINGYSDGWDDDAMTLGPGEATFVKNTTANPITLTFVGEVNQATNTCTFKTGYTMASLFTPQAGALQTDFGYAPADKTQVLKWVNTGYLTYSYVGGEWDEEPSVGVGEGFFVKSQTQHTWTRSFKVQ